MVAKKIVITRPNHDLHTSYLHDFSKGVVKTIKETKDIHVTDLEGSKAVKKKLDNSLINENPGLVFLNGHGNKSQVFGYKDKIILDKNNINLTNNKIIYFH